MLLLFMLHKPPILNRDALYRKMLCSVPITAKGKEERSPWVV